MKVFAETELILTGDGRVYHLQLRSEDIADTVLLVGDPARVELISRNFEQITFQRANREFITHTGTYKGRRLTVLSTGIGPDNIDIVVNELDAAVNIDPSRRTLRPVQRKLRLIRLGTCGALQEDIRTDSLICSSHAIGFDGLLNFYGNTLAYCDEELSQAFIRHSAWPHKLPYPYSVRADSELMDVFSDQTEVGITVTAPGFYAPQGRELRLACEPAQLHEVLRSFRHRESRILNFEMETSALYGLGKMLGHSCLTICVVIANRATRQFSKDHDASVNKLIDHALQNLLQLA